MPTRSTHSQTEAQLGNSGVRDFAESDVNDVDRVRAVAAGSPSPPAREAFTPPRFDDERPKHNADRKLDSTESGWEQGARTQSKHKRAPAKPKQSATKKKSSTSH